MKTIQTLTDLKALETDRFSKQLVLFIADLFSRHSEELGNDEQLLSENPIYVCEADDPLLHWISKSPFGPEYVEMMKLHELTLYRVGIMLDNESFVQYLVLSEIMNEETRRWLTAYANCGGENR